MAETGQQYLRQALDAFLTGVERRALVMAEMATGNRQEALDIIQEAMLRFVRAYAAKPESEWPPLFYRVVQNRIKDWYRRQPVLKRRLLIESGAISPVDSLHAPANHSPDALVEQHDAVERMLKDMARLPLRQRQAVMLRVWEGLDVAQTAQAMGCSSGSVKTHFFRAVRTLRRGLEEHV